MASSLNIGRIQDACRRIEERQKALDWLRQYGDQLTDSPHAKVCLDTITASSCPGFRQAATEINQVATSMIGTVVAQAIANCEAGIAEEVSKVQAAVATPQERAHV